MINTPHNPTGPADDMRALAAVVDGTGVSFSATRSQHTRRPPSRERARCRARRPASSGIPARPTPQAEGHARPCSPDNRAAEVTVRDVLDQHAGSMRLRIFSAPSAGFASWRRFSGGAIFSEAHGRIASARCTLEAATFS